MQHRSWDRALQYESPGWQPLSALLAATSLALADMDRCEATMFAELSPWRQVAYRYLAGDCDKFAIGLHRVTGWKIIGNSAHRLVQGPDALLDASGWITANELRQRYREWWTEFDHSKQEHNVCWIAETVHAGVDVILAEVVSAIRQFPWAPYNTREFQQMSFRPVLGVDIPYGDA